MDKVKIQKIFNSTIGGVTDTTRPTCTITCDVSSPSAAATFNYTITFSESVTGFEVGDFGITGGSKGALGGSGAIYTCAVTPAGNAPVVATVAQNVCQDAAGNLNMAATPLSIGVQTTYTYQPDSSTGQDTEVRSSSGDTSFGTSSQMTTNSTNRNSFVKFPISLGASPTIVSGTLSLWGDGTAPANSTMTLRRILAANSNWSINSTWNYRVPSTERWAGDAGGDGGADAGGIEVGTDLSNTALGTFNVVLNDPAGTQYNSTLDVAELALMCSTNNGFAIRGSVLNTILFRTCNHATAGTRPKLVLVVNYLP